MERVSLDSRSRDATLANKSDEVFQVPCLRQRHDPRDRAALIEHYERLRRLIGIA